MRYYTQDDVVKMLESKQGVKMQKDFAEEVGVSAPFLANVMAKVRMPDSVILGFLGLEQADRLYLRVGKGKR
jgi:hypothetical protein